MSEQQDQDASRSQPSGAPESAATEAQPSAEGARRQRVVQLRDHLANVVHDQYFNMAEWRCGTVACIGGWAEALFFPGRQEATVGEYEIAEELGLTAEQADDLFFMTATERKMKEVGRAEAVAVLDHYLATGKIDWDAV